MKPGYLYVKDTVRPTYALKNEMEAVDNGEKAVITAPMPLMPIYKGMPGLPCSLRSFYRNTNIMSRSTDK